MLPWQDMKISIEALLCLSKRRMLHRQKTTLIIDTSTSIWLVNVANKLMKCLEKWWNPGFSLRWPSPLKRNDASSLCLKANERKSENRELNADQFLQHIQIFGDYRVLVGAVPSQISYAIFVLDIEKLGLNQCELVATWAEIQVMAILVISTSIYQFM